jgi:hypothetical protein
MNELNLNTKTLAQDIAKAIQLGLRVTSHEPSCGCGRAYVCLSKVPKNVLNAYKKGAELAGVRYLNEAYGSGSRALYIGYDNCDGRALSQAKAVAEKLKAIGLPVYWDAVDD